MKVPLSLYVHFPWCIKKCPYCDFNSHVHEGEVPQHEYIDTLLKDLDQDLGGYDGREIQSIFMGGGTPSLFEPNAINRLMVGLKAKLNLALDIEITLEANPGASDFEKFSGYHAAGINRISIGVQSFNTIHLNQLGRIHSSHDALNAYQAAKDAGFNNINLDLMHGLSQQSLDGALGDIKQAIDLGPTHISWYQLTIEPNTQFYNQPPLLPGDDLLWSIYEAGLQVLKDNGYGRYEVSAFSLQDKRSRHNMNYWLFGDYLGIGAGAHGKITHQGKVIRTARTRVPKHYMNKQNVKSVTLSNEDLILEFLMNALRLKDGFSLDLFEQRTGLGSEVLKPFLERGLKAKLLEVENDQVMPGNRGLQFLNELLLLV
ncbi:MAG: putative oxygen-independent coproporphyrinogen III oxidase [Flavobacterium sp.]